MTELLKLLHIENDPTDALLAQRHLQGSGVELQIQLVPDSNDLMSALHGSDWDIVLCGLPLPGFDATRLLQTVRERLPEVPFIVLADKTGAEEPDHPIIQVAHDVIPKRRPHRLVPAIRRGFQRTAQRNALAKAEAAVRTNTEDLLLARGVLEALDEGLVVTSLDGRILYVNPAYERITGYGIEEVIGQNPSILKSGRHPPSFYEEMWQTLREHGHWRGEVHNRRKNGAIFPQSLAIRSVKGATGITQWYTGIIQDLSREYAHRARIAYLANHDSLTGLPGRELFRQRLRETISTAATDGGQCAVMVIDVDGFRHINQCHGPQTGDDLLKRIARRLEGAVPEGSVVARFGSDEFLVLVANPCLEALLPSAAERVLNSIAVPMDLAGSEVSITASIGIATYPKDGADPFSLLRAADNARATLAGRHGNRFALYEAGMEAITKRRLLIEQHLRHAIARDEFRLEYQPQFLPETGVGTGVEALLRWHSPVLGLVPPSEFIPVAEANGLIGDIGRWVLLTATTQAARWINTGLPAIRMAVNVSAHQLSGNQLVEDVDQALAASGLPPELLELELTESVIMEDLGSAICNIEALTDRGVSIALDDFGTGYSSLTHLSRFPLHAIKIDRSFVHSFLTDDKSAVIVRATIGLARGLGLRVIAEGVETAEQHSALVSAGCDQMQGFLFSHPLPPCAAREFIRLSNTTAPSHGAELQPCPRDAACSLCQPAATALLGDTAIA